MVNKVMKAMRRLHRGEQGMTGLETAIILIAFVTVASVFAYSVLSAGLWSAERGKETIYTGLEQARANMEIVGSVVAVADNLTPTQVKLVKFTVKNSLAGNPIDLTENDGSGTNKTTISIITAYDFIQDIEWSTTPIGDNDADSLLESGEQFEITIDASDLGAGKALTTELEKNLQFTLQVKPPIGSSITIERTLPPQIDDIMDLH